MRERPWSDRAVVPDARPGGTRRADGSRRANGSCRPVADTGKMSMHGYGAAIDLNDDFSDYWLWQKKTDPNSLPQPDAARDRRRVRAARIYLGRQVVSLRYHALEYRPELLGQ